MARPRTMLRVVCGVCGCVMEGALRVRVGSVVRDAALAL